MAGLTKLLSQLRELWGKLGARARALVVTVAALGGVAAIVVGIMGGAPMRVLFSGLDPKDAAAVVAALDAAKIPHSLDGGGSTIEVPANDIDRARLMLAEQDLPKSGNIGFEFFATQSFGVTEFAQRVNYRRALQGELERTIAALEPVASVRVHITQPDRAVFEQERLPSTASVTVELRKGRELGDRQVGAIRHLVAAAVEGLDSGDVTVVTTEGALLSRAGTDSASEAALDHELDLERDLERRITRLLERTVGGGGVEVTVAADMDFSRIDTTEETFDPEQPALRNESTQESSDKNSSNGFAGVAGAQANAPGVGSPQGPSSEAGSSHSVRARNYELNRTIVRTVGPRATLKRLTVAVLVDGQYTPAEDGAEPVYTPRSDAELAQMQAVVENAMGFDSARGDRVKIASVQFRDRISGEGTRAPEPVSPMLWAAIAGGALLLVVAVVLAKRRKAARVVPTEVLTLPARVGDAEVALARAESGNALPGAPGQAALPESPEAARERALELAAADPERTADIIRGWLRADQPA